MGEFWWSYWWLIFPLGYFVFAAWDRWERYQRSRHALDVMKEYAAQGKDPPPELARQAREHAYGDGDFRGPWRHRYRRYWGAWPQWDARTPPDPADPTGPGRDWRPGGYWEWRSVVITGAVAAGFWIASAYSYVPGADGPFRLVAIILTLVAAGNLVLALISSRFRGK